MQRRSFMSVLVGFVCAAAGFLTGRSVPGARAQEIASKAMMGGDMGDMMAPENMSGPMRTGMELFERHKLRGGPACLNTIRGEISGSAAG